MTGPGVKFALIPVDYNPVSYSQVGRLFMSMVTPWIRPRDIILLSDIDMMPLNRSIYDKINSTGIFILNADCCGKFEWNGTFVSMQPMSYIGMTKLNWKRLMRISESHSSTLDNGILFEFINTWLENNLKWNISTRNVQKGGNKEWFMDQRVVSIMIHINTPNIPICKLIRRPWVRVDRRSMDWRDFKSHIDCHMYLPSYSGIRWENTLINDIFDTNTTNILKLFKYNFAKLKGSI